MDSEMAQNKSTNAVKEQALSIGLSQATEPIKQDVFKFKLTQEEKIRLDKLCEFWGAPWKITIPIAIKSALSNAQAKNIPVNEEVNGSTETQREHSVDVQLDSKTLGRLEKANMIDRFNECAVVGINWLYEKLIQDQPKTTT